MLYFNPKVIPEVQLCSKTSKVCEIFKIKICKNHKPLFPILRRPKHQVWNEVKSVVIYMRSIHIIFFKYYKRLKHKINTPKSIKNKFNC